MAFSVRTQQLVFLGASLTAGYWSIKRCYSCINSISSSIFGSISLSNRIEKFSIDFFSREASVREFIFGSDNQKTRNFNLKRGVKHALEAVCLGFLAYLFITIFNTPESKDSVIRPTEKSEDFKNKAEELLKETLPLIDKWGDNICYNEAIQWAALPLLTPCLDPSSPNPSQFQHKRAALLDKKATDPTKNCSNLMILLGGISFYKVDLFQQQLKEIEVEYKRLLDLLGDEIERARDNFEIYLSRKYLGDWKQLGLGRILSINHKVLCSIAFYPVFEGLEKDCSTYQGSIIDLENKLLELKKAIGFTDGIVINCNSNLELSKEVLGNFSLPESFHSLIQNNKFQEVADFFISHGGVKPIEEMRFNFSSIPISECNHKQQESMEDFFTKEEVFYQRSFRSTARALNAKARFLFAQDRFKDSNQTLNQYLMKIKGVVVS